MISLRYTRVSIAISVLLVSATSLAGELDPPPGSIGATMKALSEVEPRVAINAVNTPGDADSVFKITEPGSYYLTAGITGESGKSAIEIESADVTVDLNGFTLRGVPGSWSAIRAAAVLEGVTIRNGIVRDWGEFGVSLFATVGAGVRDVTAIGNVAGGFGTGEGSLMTNCVARDNVGAGILAGRANRVIDCSATGNGSHGILTSEHSSIAGCTARNNGGLGIAVNGAATFTDCVAGENAQGGFLVGSGSILTGCSANDNGAIGFWVSSTSSAVNCAATENATDGFYVNAGSVINCIASTNGRDGIRLETGNGLAVGNSCRGNGTAEPGAGVRAVQTACRIDSNQVVENDFGIVATTDCIVVRNTARANASGNYWFPSGPSEYGQIITNPGANFASTNPWANFAY